MTAAGMPFRDFEGVSQTPYCGGSRPPRAAGPLCAATAGWGHSSVRASPSLCCPRPAPEEGPGPGRPRPRHHPPGAAWSPRQGPGSPGWCGPGRMTKPLLLGAAVCQVAPLLPGSFLCTCWSGLSTGPPAMGAAEAGSDSRRSLEPAAQRRAGPLAEWTRRPVH